LDIELPLWHDFLVGNLPRRQLMTLTAHIAELAEKHRTLELKINQAIASPGSDDIEVRRWKQEKLKLKDEMERLRRETRH
jgi:hypothetical protein